MTLFLTLYQSFSMLRQMIRFFSQSLSKFENETRRRNKPTNQIRRQLRERVDDFTLTHSSPVLSCCPEDR